MQADHDSGIFRNLVPLIAFSKGEYAPISQGEGHKNYFSDVFVRKGKPEKEWHPYQQGVGEAEYYISRLTQPGDLVADLCAGSFTAMIATARVGGRGFVGCDLDERNVRIARERFAAEVTDAKTGRERERPTNDDYPESDGGWTEVPDAGSDGA